MHNQRIQQALREVEFDRLGEFLEGMGESAMNLEMLDGFFAALICGPESVLPSEYLPHVFGKELVFESNEQATEIIGLLMRHWNTIASTLARTLEKDDVYLPVLFENADGVAPGNDWAQGFIRGVRLRTDSWDEVIGSDETPGPIFPMLILAHEHDFDPASRPPEIKPEFRDELLQTMIVALTQIYRYFAPHRQSIASVPLRRQGPKVGRNDPCPCKSGRKYKHCCAAGAPMFH